MCICMQVQSLCLLSLLERVALRFSLYISFNTQNVQKWTHSRTFIFVAAGSNQALRTAASSFLGSLLSRGSCVCVCVLVCVFVCFSAVSPLLLPPHLLRFAHAQPFVTILTIETRRTNSGSVDTYSVSSMGRKKCGR
jgi:hypothetical protein